jgi:diadenosine tetraphosphate (Ap4A) HIT family hydrolase
VILKRHAREMTDLAPAERDGLMAVVFAVESAVRETMRPDKMNIASLGNMTPHVHWHVVPRFRDDRHFPGRSGRAAARAARAPDAPPRAGGIAAAIAAPGS